MTSYPLFVCGQMVLLESPELAAACLLYTSLAPPGQSIAFSLGDEKGFAWIGAYDITADELLAGTDTAKTESKRCV